jgi:hypothetical protein
MKILRLGCLVLAVVLARAETARADFLLTDAGTGNFRNGWASNSPVNATSFTGTIGTTFQVTQTITVTSLGFFDGPNSMPTGFVNNQPSNATGKDGLVGNDHQIGIWLAGAINPLASVTGAAVQNGTLSGDFRYATITPLVLTAGQTYVIGAFVSWTSPTVNDGDVFRDFNNGGVGHGYVAPGLGSAIVNNVSGGVSPGRAYSSTGTFSDPTNGNASTDSGGYVGPNFQYTPGILAAAPAPSSLVIASLGVFGVALYGWRKQRKAILS